MMLKIVILTIYCNLLHHFEQDFSMVKYLVIFLYGREKEPLLKVILYDLGIVPIYGYSLYYLEKQL